MEINRLLGYREEKKDHRFDPIEVDTVLQLQAINEVSLSGEYIDANIVVVMSWTDKRLRWRPRDHGYIRKIRADRNQVWIPDVEVVNRLHDFSPLDEKISRVHIHYDGRVVNTRMFRLRANFSPSIYTYPYDLQIATFSIASTDYSVSKVKVSSTF